MPLIVMPSDLDALGHVNNDDAARTLIAEAVVRPVRRNSASSIATEDVLAALGDIVRPGPMPSWIASWARSLEQAGWNTSARPP